MSFLCILAATGENLDSFYFNVAKHCNKLGLSMGASLVMRQGERIEAKDAEIARLTAERVPLSEPAISHCINQSGGALASDRLRVLARNVERQCALAWGVQLRP